MTKQWVITLTNLENQKQLEILLDEETNWFCFHNQCIDSKFESTPGFEQIESPTSLRIKDGKLLLCFMENSGIIGDRSPLGEIYEDVNTYIQIPECGITISVANRRINRWLTCELIKKILNNSSDHDLLTNDPPENPFEDLDCDTPCNDYKIIGRSENIPLVYGKKSYNHIRIDYKIKEKEY